MYDRVITRLVERNCLAYQVRERAGKDRAAKTGTGTGGGQAAKPTDQAGRT